MIFRLLVLGLVLAAPAAADPALDAAVALFDSQHFPAARAAFEKIIAAEPANAAACHYLGLTLVRRGDDRALDDALPWLEKATQLDPKNATYLADFGGVSMQLAGKNTSITAANRGRDAMEQAIALDPANLAAREGLYQFYSQAPWPIGSSSKAAAQLAEITQRDPERGLVLGVVAKTKDKKFAEAFKICDDLLAKNPANYTALYQYGRTASISGQNLERGLSCLQQCVALPPPGPAAPQPTNAWFRIGAVLEKLARPAEARTAYETALKLDAGNKSAADALAKLK